MTVAEQAEVNHATQQIGELLSAAAQAAHGSEQIIILEQLHEALRQQLTVASRA